MTEDRLQHWLTQFRKAWWQHRCGKLFAVAAPLSYLLATISLLAENIWHFSPAVRMSMLVTTAIPLVVWAIYQLFAIIQKSRNNYPTDITLAKQFRQLPGGHGRLLNAVELREDPSPLAAMAVEQATEEIVKYNSSQLFLPISPTRKLYRRLLVGVVAFLVAMILPGGRDAFARLLNPRHNFEPPAPFRLEWVASDDFYAYGEPLIRTLQLIPEGIAPVPEDGEVVVREVQSGKTKNYPIHFENLRAELRIADAAGELELTAKVQSVFSRKLEVTPFYRIRLTENKIQIIPPGYSGMAPHEATGGGDQSVLPGTRVEWNAKGSGEIGLAYLLYRAGGETDTIGVKYSGQSLAASITVRKSGSLQMVLQDAKGRNGTAPPSLKLELMPDESPRVLLLSPDADGDLPGSFQLPVVARADDDFGIGAMYLVYRVEKNGTAGKWDSLKLPHQKIEPASAGIALQWDASRYDLIPDDALEFFVSALDQNNVTGPGRGISEVRKFKVPSLEHWMEETEKSHESIANSLESLSKNGERVAQSLEALAQKLKRKGELSHEEKEQLRAAGEKQQSLVEKAEKAAKELRELSKKMEESGAAARETMEKISRLQELMDELASPELKAALQQLQEAVKKMDQNQIKAAMEQVKFDQQQWKEKLDRTLALLEQLRLERRLDMLEQWSKKVAEQARRNEMSVDSTKNNANKRDSLATEQNKLANESKALEEQTAQTADDAAKNPHLDASDAQQLKDAEKPENAASQPIRKSASSLQQQQSSPSKQQAKQGAQKAEQLAENLAKMNKKLRENAKQDLADKMSRRIGELLELAASQQKLAEQYNALDARTPQARTMAERQDGLRRGLKNTIDSIGNLGKETFFLPRSLLGNLKNTENLMNACSQSITERVPGGAKPGQQEARAMMTQAAAELLQAMGEMQQSSSSTGYEEMMKALAEMARRQAEINDKTGSMPGQQGEPMPGNEGDPMDMPGGSAPGSTPGMMQQLAAEQGALSQMMKSLEQQSQQMKDLTGRLDGIGDQMSESEKQLRDKTVSERTQRLQKQILTRLLDAQRSLQRQDYTQKRESQSGRDLGGRVTINYDPNSIENQLRQRLLELSRMGVDPLWQQRIRSYWQSLQQQQANVDSSR